MKNRIFICLLALSLIPFPGILKAGDSLEVKKELPPVSPEKAKQSTPRININFPGSKISISGYYRFLGYHRNTMDLFDQTVDEKSVYQLDDGYRSPTLNLNMKVRTTSNTFVGWQMFVFNPMEGIGGNSYVQSLNRQGMTLNGGIKTKKGNFTAWLGGIQFQRFSDFTLSSAQQFRNSLFDRTPWTWVFNTGAQYGSYYSEGSYRRDVIWGMRAINGMGVKGEGLPGNFGFNFFYGKTPFNLATIPDNITAVQVSRKIKLQEFYLNVLDSRGISANTNGSAFGNSTFSFEYKGNVQEWLINSELAYGSYFTPTGASNGDIAFNIRAKLPKRILKFPLSAELYHIGSEFSNVHSSLINTSVTETQFSFAGENISDGARPIGAAMTPMHLKSNNRQGINLNGDVKIWKLNLNLGYALSRELNKEDNRISYYHKVNGLFLSRADPFQPDGGPYKTFNTYFRGAYEVLEMFDTLADGSLRTERKFNVALINTKFNSKIFGKDLFVFYLGELQSVQDKISPIPVLSNKSYLHTLFHEFDIYYSLNKKLALVGYLGFENINGNNMTSVGENGLPRRQRGQAVGGGVDIKVAKMSVFYLRAKWSRNKDVNFINDHYEGLEASAELKVIF